MPKFNVDDYLAELEKLSESVAEMNIAINNLQYECGPNGVVRGATTYLRDFLNALEAANKQQAEVSKAMITGLQL